MRRLPLATVTLAVAISVGEAQTAYPIDRADILVGSRFDFKVEFPGFPDAAKVDVTLTARTTARSSARSPLSWSARTARISRR